MNRVRQRWICALGLSLGLLCAGCEKPDAPPGAAAALQQKRALQQQEAPEVSVEVGKLLDELDDAVEAARGAMCGEDESIAHLLEVRAKVAALGPELIPVLLHRMEHTDRYHGRSAIHVFSYMAQHDAQPALAPLVRLIERAPLWVRLRALDSLLAIDVLDLPTLEALVRVRNDPAQLPAVRAWVGAVITWLTTYPDRRSLRYGAYDPAPALRRLLEDEEDPQLRWEAVVALGDQTRATREIVDALAHALIEDESAGVRAQAATALSTVAYAYSVREQGVVALTRALDDPEPRVRAAAAGSLGVIGPHAESAVPALTRALHDREDDVQVHAIQALSRIGPEAAAAIPELQRPDAAWIRHEADEGAREVAGAAAAQ